MSLPEIPGRSVRVSQSLDLSGSPLFRESWNGKRHPVLMSCYEYPPIGGGGSRVVANLCRDLTALGLPVDLVTMAFGDLLHDEWQDGLRIFRIPGIRSHIEICHSYEMVPYLLGAFNKIFWRLRSQQYRVNHTHFIFPDGVVAWAIKKAFGLPYIITAHGSDVPGYNPDRFNYMHRVLAPLWRQITTEAELIICPSRHLERLVLAANSKARTHVTPNGIKLDQYRADRPKQKRILVVTRMFERKGVQFLLQALARLDSYPEVNIVGDGPYLPHLREMAAELKIEVNFLGFLDNKGQTFRDLLETSQYFVFTSSAENFPVVLLEAMCAGMSIITSNDSGCVEVVDDAALTIPAQQVDALRAALQQLLSNDELAADLARRARQRVAARFGSEAVTEEHLWIYERVGKRRFR